MTRGNPLRDRAGAKVFTSMAPRRGQPPFEQQPAFHGIQQRSSGNVGSKVRRFQTVMILNQFDTWQPSGGLPETGPMPIGSSICVRQADDGNGEVGTVDQQFGQSFQ